MTPSASAARPRSILVVHPALPAHDEDSGSRRLRWIVELLVRQGHRVTFLGFAGKTQERYAAPLREMGVEVHLNDPRWWRDNGYDARGPGIDVRGLLRRGRFDIAWISTYQMAEIYLAEIRRESPATRVVLDTVDVHHLRERRGAELAGDPAALTRSEETRRREEAVYQAVDRLVAVSEDDARELGALAPEVPVSVVSNIHELAPAGPGFDGRRGAVFVGSFNHPPNADAVLAFVAGAWPAVRRTLPDATFTVVGTNPPAPVLAIDGRDGITVTGWVPSTAPYLDAARVSVAPLRYGAGVKGKIGEALSHGLPVVTTNIGAEGMGLVDGEQALIADDDAGLAAAVVRLHEDRALWEQLAVRGREHVDSLLGVGAAATALEDVVSRTAVRPFVVTDPWTEPGTLPSVLEGYLGAFAPTDPVSLVLPVPPDGLGFQDAAERAHAALAALGADPETVPDVSLQVAVADAVVPAGGVRVGVAPWPEAPTPVVEPTAPPEAWRAADPGDAARSVADRPIASIVICCYGKRAYTERCLASLDAALGARLGDDVELVLVDNASRDDTRDLLTAWADRARLVLLDKNENFSGGNNAGARVATGRVLLFLNNDTEVGPGAIEALVADALRPGIGLVGARLLYADGRVQHGGFGWRATEALAIVPFHAFRMEDGAVPAVRASFETSGATGACIAVPAELFHEVGGFVEGYVNGWEDADLCQRIRDTGARVWYRGDVEIVHHEGITSGGDYGRDGNEALFRGHWNRVLEPDDVLLHRQLGARLGLLGRGPIGGTAADGAGLGIIAPILGFGAAGAEGRALLRALTAQGVDVAARTPAPSWVRPMLPDADEELLTTAHDRDARPGAAAIVVPDGSVPADASLGGTVVLRTATVPAERPEGALAWAATPAVAEELRRAGWPAAAVLELPPVVVPAEVGSGGGGVLALLPDHDPAAREALLAALATVESPVVVLPVARTPELALELARRLPGATLLDPTADEGVLAELAAEADVVVAADRDDPFDRRALVAAGAGAAVVAGPGGPAQAVLGDAVAIAEPTDLEALTRALAVAASATDAAARRRRAALVAQACGPHRLLAALRALAGDVPVDPAGDVPAVAPESSLGRPDLGDFAWAAALRDDLDQFVEKVNRYTAKEADAVQDAPPRPWADVVRDARDELLRRWAPDADGGQSAALSMAMLFYRFLEGAKHWERHGFPDVGLPATGTEALRDLAGEGRLAHQAGVAAFGQGDLQAATGHLERAVRDGFDPEAVNDLAVACHAAGDLERAGELLRACLVLAPDHPAALENLAAVEAALSGARAPA